jgi:aspartate racemase
MTQHIGIVAYSAEGAARCYRTICAMVLDTWVRTPPQIPMHTHSLAEYVACLDRGDI